MMKKCLSILLVLMLMLPVSALAQGMVAQPTVEEIEYFCGALLQEALKAQPVTPEAAEAGGYLYDFGSFVLVSPDQKLSENSQITCAVLQGGMDYREDMRQIAPGSSLDAVLDAYPIDNTSLRGTYSEAALFISGMLPGVVNTGRVVRNGSHVLVAEYDIYTNIGDETTKTCVIYTLENNEVIAVEILPSAQVMPLSDAQAEIDALAALQEENEYSVYSAELPEVLAREDLSFGGIDFISADPDAVKASLGAPNSDTWENDGAGFLRVMQWEGAQAIFQYDGSKTNAVLSLLQVFTDMTEGPRGLHLGDNEESVLARFPNESDGALLYGDGENAPYGLYETTDGSVHMTFAVDVDGKTVLLSLTLIDGHLEEMICNYR